MKLSTLILALPLLVACSTVPAPKPAPTAPPVEAAPANVVIDNAEWSLKLPAGWQVKEMPDGVMARAPNEMLAVAVKSQDLEPDLPAADFGGAAVLAALQVEDVVVMQATPHTISGKPGSVTLLKTDGVILLQYAVGSGKKGFLLVCGGPASGTIVKTCQPILDTFRLK